MAEANPEARPQAPNAAEVILELSNELGVQVSELPNLPVEFLAGVIAASGRTNAEKAAQHLALFKLRAAEAPLQQDLAHYSGSGTRESSSHGSPRKAPHAYSTRRSERLLLRKPPSRTSSGFLSHRQRADLSRLWKTSSSNIFFLGTRSLRVLSSAACCSTSLCPAASPCTTGLLRRTWRQHAAR